MFSISVTAKVPDRSIEDNRGGGTKNWFLVTKTRCASTRGNMSTKQRSAPLVSPQQRYLSVDLIKWDLYPSQTHLYPLPHIDGVVDYRRI